jgi:hypothetical protein
MMTNEAIELMVEEIMRQYHFGDFDAYNSEELRAKYRKMLQEDE